MGLAEAQHVFVHLEIGLNEADTSDFRRYHFYLPPPHDISSSIAPSANGL